MTKPRLEMCGAAEVPARDADDPSHFVVIHRDVGGPALRDKHRPADVKCWCNPLVVTPEDARLEIYQEQFRGMERLN